MDGDAADDTIVAMFTVLKSVYPSSLIDNVGRVNVMDDLGELAELYELSIGWLLFGLPIDILDVVWNHTT